MFSQLLTLYTTPVIYLAFDRLAKRVSSTAQPSRASFAAPEASYEFFRAVHPPTRCYHTA